MRCDVIAEGVIAAAKNIEINIPLIVRLAGTNVEKGKEILNNSGLDRLQLFRRRCKNRLVVRYKGA